MKITDKEKREILKTVLSDEYTSEQMQDIAGLDVVEQEMKKQWDSGENIPVDIQLKQQIWNKILAGCFGQQKRKVRYAYIGRAAAVFILITCGILLLLNRQKEAEKYTRITALHNQEYVLPDSSKVWMQAGSTIKYAGNFMQDRKVWQEGNALFEVYKHQGSVFRVYIVNAFVEVKGTCFEIRQIDSIRNEVSLYRGAVDFNTDGNSTSMQPMQKLLYNARDSKVEGIEGVDHMNWEEDRFVFTNINLSELIGFMNRFYHTQIIVGENVNESDSFTGGIRYTESLDEVLKKLCYVVNLKMRKDGEQIIIYK